MKTNIFNFERVGLLFQRYFIERFRSELIYWGIMAIVFMFLRNSPQIAFGLLAVAGIFYAARFFKEIHHSANGIAYFMIPATQLEKLTVAIVMSTIYYFVMMMIVYVMGNLTGTFLNNVLASMDFFPNAIFHHSSLQWSIVEGVNSNFFVMTNNEGGISYSISFITGFLFFQSIFLLGGIYFKRNQAFKTFLTLVIIGLFLAILVFVEVKLILGDEIFHAGIDLNLSPSSEMADIFRIFLLLFFWVVSYFRLTEKQV